MNNGVLSRVVLGGLLSFAAVGCGGSSDDNSGGAGAGPKMGAATADCGTVQEPRTIELSNVSPALGATVPNTAIVQTFTIVGQHLLTTPTFGGLPGVHTAGQQMPSPVGYTPVISGADLVYTSQPLTWQNAPAHVELVPSSIVYTDDGCVWTFPTPIFEYDVTAP